MGACRVRSTVRAAEGQSVIAERIQIFPTVSAFRERLPAPFDLLFSDRLPSQGFIKLPERIRGQNPHRHRTEASSAQFAYQMSYQQRSKAPSLYSLKEINRVKLAFAAQPARPLGAAGDKSHNTAVPIRGHQRY